MFVTGKRGNRKAEICPLSWNYLPKERDAETEVGSPMPICTATKAANSIRYTLPPTKVARCHD